MDHDLQSTLLKVAIPVALIAFVLLVSRLRRFSLREDLRLVWPRPKLLLLWLAVWIGWMALGEVAIRVFGMEQPAPWRDYSPLVVALRILAIGVLGPAAEEIVVRGLLFFRLARTRLGPAGAVLLCAAGWAALHYRYEWGTILLIFLDGVVLGLARWQARSTNLPIVMHSLGNLLSIWQSLHG
jgi:membrane protease YdiL (CAAX protease family)